MLERVRIATRESALALWQANDVAARLRQAFPGVDVQILGMTTTGDRNKTSPLSKLGGKGVFVKELEQALLEGTADIAVHSMKDVPAELPEGLGIAAICPREDPRDAFVSNRFATLADMPPGARVGTSSLRRRLQIQRQYPELAYPELRGNVDTRLRKLDDGDYDAIILACAGLKRLGLESRVREPIDPRVSIPAAGQGAVGIECAMNNEPLLQMLAAIEDPDTALCVHCERLISAGLGATCNLPIAGHATLDGDTFHIAGFVSAIDGSRDVNVERSGPRAQAREIATDLVEALLAEGGGELIDTGG